MLYKLGRENPLQSRSDRHPVQYNIRSTLPANAVAHDAIAFQDDHNVFADRFDYASIAFRDVHLELRIHFPISVKRSELCVIL